MAEETKKHAGGRPLTWTDKEMVQKVIDQYFKNQKNPTMAGLAEALDISRSTLYNYEEKDEFMDTIKKARQRIELIYEDILIYGSQPTGVIFALKNLGWRDKVDTDITSGGKPIPIIPLLK